jgi:hypothetical protein
VYVVPDTPVNDPPGESEYPVTALLSVMVAVKNTAWLVFSFVREMLDTEGVKLLMEGAWLSLLETLTVRVAVSVFPAASSTVAVTVSFWLPKL